MIYFKGCPRCGGDVATARDGYGGFAFCVQCGHTVHVLEPGPTTVRPALGLRARRPVVAGKAS